MIWRNSPVCLLTFMQSAYMSDRVVLRTKVWAKSPIDLSLEMEIGLTLLVEEEDDEG